MIDPAGNRERAAIVGFLRRHTYLGGLAKAIEDGVHLLDDKAVGVYADEHKINISPVSGSKR